MEYNKKLHKAFITIVEHDLNYLSKEGQERWNELAHQNESQIRECEPLSSQKSLNRVKDK